MQARLIYNNIICNIDVTMAYTNNVKKKHTYSRKCDAIFTDT